MLLLFRLSEGCSDTCHAPRLGQQQAFSLFDSIAQHPFVDPFIDLRRTVKDETISPEKDDKDERYGEGAELSIDCPVTFA